MIHQHNFVPIKRGYPQKICTCGAMKIGANTITMSPGGTDVVRWSATQAATAAGDVGMNTTSGRLSTFVGGGAADVAVLSDLSGTGTAHAADVVVDAGGGGDATTVEAGIAALPAGGGTVYVREGTYAPAATIALPAKDFQLRGSGIGNTTITMPTNTPLFSLATDQEVIIDGFTINGDDTFSQDLLAGGTLGGCVMFRDIHITNLRNYVDATGDIEVHFRNVEIDLPNSPWAFWANTVSNVGKCVWQYVELNVLQASTVAMMGRPEWVVLNSYIGGGPPDLSTWEADQLYIHGLTADMSQISTFAGPSHIVGFFGTDCRLRFDQSFGTVSGCVEQRTQIDIFTGLEIRDCKNVVVSNCFFDGGGFTASDTAISFLENAPVASEGFAVTGCVFRGWEDEAIRVDETEGLIVSGNYFHSDNGQAIAEFATQNASDFNFYVNNIGMFGSTLSGANSKLDNNIRTVTTTPVTMDEYYDALMVDATTASATVNLPAAADALGKIYYIKKIDATGNTVTIDPSGAETIDGAATEVISTQFQSRTVISDGTEWHII